MEQTNINAQRVLELINERNPDLFSWAIATAENERLHQEAAMLRQIISQTTEDEDGSNDPDDSMDEEVSAE